VDAPHLKGTSIEAAEDEKAKHQFEQLSTKILGATILFHKHLGPRFLESIYEEALKIELSEHGMPYDFQKEIVIQYLGVEIGRHPLDLLVGNKIIVELKAMKQLTDIHFAQLSSYLKATGLKVGLLLNFAEPTLEIRRVVN